jgi:tryptophanyl-tRNA synthetase
MYPVLMGADILMFNAHKVPVGRDQVQHLEMARDMGNSFNHRYGAHFVLPEVVIEESVATLPGTDGRKMSKSYDNHIPLFAPRAQLKKLIGGIVTDSRAPGEPKDVAGSALFQIFQAFATDDETDTLRQAYTSGISWADAKNMVFERLDRELAPMRERYETLMRDPGAIEDILVAGAVKARKLSAPFMAQLRHAVGLRNLRASTEARAGKTAKAAMPSFKQYRESDGRFHFKLVDAQGRLLLQSQGFASPKDAGAAIGRLQKEGDAAWQAMADQLAVAEGVGSDEVTEALRQLVAASTSS